MRPLTCIALALLAVAASQEKLSAQAPTIAQLDWLVGEWTFEDIEIDGDYRESGTRTCKYVLGGEYIVCESQGTNHRGRERTYLWYFNYNDEDQRFEITSLFQGYPRKLLDTVTVHDGGRQLEISSGSWEGDEILVEGGATVTYDGSDQYVWETERFRDVVTRR